jgi:hypothetical protein
VNERIKELAEQAGIGFIESGIVVETSYRDIERFAELVRQEEREACAKLCEEENWSYAMGNIIRSERGVA